MDLKKRSEMNKEYMWDLSHIYENKEKWEAALKSAAEKITQLKDLRGTLCESPKSLKNAFDNAVFSKISGYISTLCIAVTLFNITIRLWDNIRSVLTEMNVMVTAMLPVMAGLYSAGGNTAAAAVSNSGMMVFIAVVEWICTKGLYPFLQICFVLSFIGCISDDSNTTGLTAYFKNFFTTALVFIMTVFSIILGYQNKIALGADTAAMKTVRYAAGSFIPVVGSAVGEASRAVAGSITMLRSSVGGVAIAALIILVLPPIINAAKKPKNISPPPNRQMKMPQP